MLISSSRFFFLLLHRLSVYHQLDFNTACLAVDHDEESHALFLFDVWEFQPSCLLPFYNTYTQQGQGEGEVITS
jgi:hypothetical protein